jgi:hypothetical protein
MKENVVPVRNIYFYSTRANQYNFRVPKSYGKDNVTFIQKAINDWNSLPTGVKKNKIGDYKSSVNAHLLEQLGNYN